METKAILYELCENYINKRVETSRLAIAEAQHSANEETKSSAGDKYETGRAMAQLEIEKSTHQLNEALKLKHALTQIRSGGQTATVQPGSLVITDRDAVFIAISIGKVTVEGDTFLVVGPGTPLAVQLIGSCVGESRVFNGQTYTVKELF